MLKVSKSAFLTAALSLLGPFILSLSALAQSTERVSVNSNEAQGFGDSLNADMNGNGSFVVFESLARLTPDTNRTWDVFRRNLSLGLTRRVSLDSSEQQTNCPSLAPSISRGGRFIAFGSCNFPGEPSIWPDIYVRDVRSGTTERVNVSSGGVQANQLSRDPDISGDGRYVAFESLASNLVAGDTNDWYDIFVHDRITGLTERVSVSSTGNQGNGSFSGNSGGAAISGDGRYVAFHSYAENFVAGDTNERLDVFLHDRVTGTTERVSVSSTGEEGKENSGEPSISPDGRYVAFSSVASELADGDTNGTWDVFVHDRLTGVTERVSVSSTGALGNDGSVGPSISPDGRYVAFSSTASNLVPDDTNGFSDAFVHDRSTGVTERVSVSSTGVQGNFHSGSSAISDDGRHVAFVSGAANLVAGDTNNSRDVFVRHLGP